MCLIQALQALDGQGGGARINFGPNKSGRVQFGQNGKLCVKDYPISGGVVDMCDWNKKLEGLDSLLMKGNL